MSTMENADVKRNKSQTEDPTPNSIINSEQIEAAINKSKENDINEKNFDDFNSKNKYLKKKREAEIASALLLKETNEFRINNAEGTSLKKQNVFCSLCDKSESETKTILKTCKICNLNYHLDCLLSNGECNFGENFTCISCRKEMNSTAKNQYLGGLNNSMMFPQMRGSQEIIQNQALNLNGFGGMASNIPPSIMNSNLDATSESYTNLNNLANSYLNSLSSQINSINNPNILNNFLKNSNNLSLINSLNSFNNNPLNNNNSSNNSLNSNHQLLLIQHLLKNDKNIKSGVSGQTSLFLQQLIQGINQKKNLSFNSSSSSNDTQNMNKLPNNLNNTNTLMNNPLLMNMNKQNNITNFNIINNLINCSNYNNINNSNPAKIDKNLLLNQISQQINNAANIPNFIMGGAKNLGNNNSNSTNTNANVNSFNIGVYPGLNSNNLNYLQNNSNFYNSANYSQNLQNNFKNSLTKPNNIPWDMNDEESNQLKINKFPIDDIILLKNPEKYGLDLVTYERPQFSKLKISANIFNKIIPIWDFLNSFDSALVNSFTKIFTNSDIEKFYEKLDDDENFKKILLSILHFYIQTIGSIETLELAEHKELFILRVLKENSNSDLSIINEKCWPLLLCIIINSKKFSLLVNEELKIIANRLYQNEISSFNMDEKICLLLFLINSAYDLPKIKNIIQTEIEKKNELSKKKSYLETEYRTKDLRKKEIEKSEKFINALNKIECLEKKLKDLENNKTANLNSNLYYKQKKELETEREKYKSLIKENEDIHIVKEKIINSLKLIKQEMNDMKITSKKMIGTDVYQNEFYFFSDIFDKIYVKKYENRGDKSNKNFDWVFFNNLNDIKLFVNKLVDKGHSEKKLKRSLNKIINKKMKFLKADVPISKEQKEENYDALTDSKLKENEMNVDISNDNNNCVYNSIPINNISHGIEIMRRIEEKFSEYLSQFNKEWEVQAIREKWKETITNYMTLENCKTSLMMINLRFKNPYRNDEPPISDKGDEKILIKDKPKFVFKDFNDNEIFSVYHFDQLNILAPKDLETNEIDKFYAENMLQNIIFPSHFFLALHFYESVLFSLIKRREPLNKNKNLIKEISEKESPVLSEILNEAVDEALNIQGKIENIENIEQEPDVNAIDDKTVSIYTDQIDVDKTESIITASAVCSEKKPTQNKQKKNKIPKKIDSSPITIFNNQIKKKKINTNRDLRPRNWRETCYICDEYGNLICCDGCTNVAHQFCACLENVPENWFCEKCVEKDKKSKRKSK